jgi:urea transporter
MNNLIKNSLSPFLILSKFAKHFASDFGSIVMVGDYHIGFFIILAAFLQPNIIISGMLGLTITILMTKILNIDKTFPLRTTLFCNSLLLGLFLGYLYVLDGMSLFLILITMSLNIVLCFTADAFFSLVQLPLLSLPFSIIALVLTLSMKKFTAIGHANYYFHEFHPEFFYFIPQELLHFFKSLGTFFCIPDTGFGLLLILSVLVLIFFHFRFYSFFVFDFVYIFY